MEDSRTKAARTHFDRWSATYEQDPVSRRLAQVQPRSLAALRLGVEDRLLDVGCGTGAEVRAAAPLVRRAVGIDLSPAMIARARALANGIANVEFHEGDVSGPLLFEDGEFTAMLCTTAFHHFSRPSETIAELERALAPGGRVVIADANRAHPAVWVLDEVLRIVQRSHVGFQNPTQLAHKLRAAGFARTSVSTMLMGAYAVVRADKR